MSIRRHIILGEEFMNKNTIIAIRTYNLVDTLKIENEFKYPPLCFYGIFVENLNFAKFMIKL